jgi:hypothetical protein
MANVSREAHLGVSFESAARVLLERPASVVGGGDTELEVQILGLEVGHQVAVEAGEPVTIERPFRMIVVPFEVHAEPDPGWYPVLEAEIEVSAGSGCGVHVAIEGQYRVPAGLVGAVLDRLTTHSIVEASVGAFFQHTMDALGREAGALDALIGVPV